MNISTVIEQLAAIKARYGDLPVAVQTEMLGPGRGEYEPQDLEVVRVVREAATGSEQRLFRSPDRYIEPDFEMMIVAFV